MSIFDDYSYNYIVQRKIEQHEELAKFNVTSANTFRIISWFDGSDVFILAAMLRAGMPGSVTDNISGGGFAFCVKKDGYLKGPALNSKGRPVEGTNNMIGNPNILVDSYEKIIKAIKELHTDLPYFGIVAWDIAINKNGSPVLIEYNLQNPGLHVIQALCGTFEGEVTDKLLLEAKKRNAL